MLYVKSNNGLNDGKLMLERLIQKIVDQSTVIQFSYNDLNYLYQESTVLSKVYYSNYYQEIKRMESLYMEILKDVGSKLKQYNKVIMLFMHSHRHQLMIKELEAVSDIVKCFPQNVVIKWGLGLDDSIGARIALYLICSK
jgi:biotin synthase-related radical SAM superfamily protein